MSAPAIPHIVTGRDGSLYGCACPRGHDHQAAGRDPAHVLAANAIAEAVESVQGFTVLSVRYAIADEVIDRLLALGWVAPEFAPKRPDGGAA